MRRDGEQQGLVTSDIIEHAGEEAWAASRGANLAGTDAGEGEEAREVLGIAGEIAERRDRQRRGRLLARLRVGFAGPPSAFPDHRGIIAVQCQESWARPAVYRPGFRGRA